MDLEWKPPIFDGGAPIDHYIIEKRDKYGDWSPCTTVPGSQTKGTAPGLVAGETYQFRVRAVNKAGPGEPSDPTEPKVAKPRKLAPRLHLDSLADVRVRAGQPITVEAKFDGEPPPQASWTVNGRPFEGQLDNRDNQSTLRIDSAARGDSGPYAITVVNEHGTDSGKCQVTVLDVPSPPVGPLKPSNIHREGCTLSWRPPEDDGGCEVIGYVVEKMDTSRGSWQEAGQFGTDCEAKIKKLTTGRRYLFRVKAVNMIGESKPLEGDREVVARDQFDVPDKPEPPAITDWDEQRIDVAWKAPADGGAPIREYIVERREKGSTAWVDCGHTPATSFSCTGLRKGGDYEFRVTAVNEVTSLQNPADWRL
jgi:predicted phage tail protein